MFGQGTTASSMYVARVDTPENNDQLVNIQGTGVEVKGKLLHSAIQKGKYYYHVNQNKDGFAKYQILQNQIVTIEECPFGDYEWVESGDRMVG